MGIAFPADGGHRARNHIGGLDRAVEPGIRTLNAHRLALRSPTISTMIARLGLFLSRTIGRCMPDPLILALGLTIVTALLALIFGYIDLDRGQAGIQLIDRLVELGYLAVPQVQHADGPDPCHGICTG